MIYKLLDISELTNLLREDVNENIEERIKYFFFRYMTDHENIVAVDGNKIIGICAVNHNTDPYFGGNTYHIEYISVDPEYRNQGVSKGLLRTAVSFISKKDAKIKYGQVSEDGQNYILENLEEICKEYSVELVRQK